MAGAGPEIAAAKQRIRTATLAARAARTDAQRDAAGLAIAQHGRDQWAGLVRLAAFVSFGSEPPTGPLLDGLVAAGTQVLVPVIDGDDLDWVAYVGGGRALGTTAIATADLVVVPALAVDRSGHRLGRGRGYYDRALVAVTAPVVAVVYDEELIESVPIEPHDRRVQGVLCPAGYLAL